MKNKIDKNVFKCPYEYNPEIGVDLGDCCTCIHDKNRTCPFGIYDDTIIEFPKNKTINKLLKYY